MERLNLDRLLDLVNERTQSVIEIELGGQVLKICDAESLPQKNRLMLARAQAELQDYYSEVLREQESVTSKLADETLSSTQRAALQRENMESSIAIAMRMLSASQALLTANVQYIEALAQMEDGALMRLIDAEMDSRGVDGDRRHIVTAMLVARASQLIRTALDDTEKNFQDKVLATVRVQESGDRVPLAETVPLAVNGKVSAKGQKNISAAAS